MVVATETSPVCDVVFVVEGTAALGGYFDYLKTSYILPTLEHFNGGPPDEIDYGCDYSCTLYSLVVFRASDCIPEPAVTCYQPTTSTHKFIQSLDDISFDGGAGEACSHVAEGLSRALLVFDDITTIREPSPANQKHCVLICNSPPYNVTANESLGYSGLLPTQLANKLGERGINLSILSPRKIPILFKLFEEAWQATREAMTPPKNYTTDSRHLVLLKGFSLQERPASPGIKKEEPEKHDVNRASQPSPSLQGVSTSQAQGQNVGSSGPASNTPKMGQQIGQQQQTQQQQQSQAQQQQQTQQQAGNGPMNPQGGMNQPGALTNNPQQQQQPNQQQQNPQQQQPPNVSITQVSQQGAGIPNNNPGLQTFNMTQTSQQQQQQQQQQFIPGMPRMPNMPMTGAMPGQPQQQQQVQQPMMPNTLTSQTSVSYTNTSMPGGDMGGQNVMAGQPVMGGASVAGDLQGNMDIAGTLYEARQNAQQQRKMIWTGSLEWQEKPKVPDPSTRITRSLPCQVSIAVGDPDVNASSWPSQLIMQLIPQNMLQPLHPLFRSSRTVTFTFNNNNDVETLKALYKVMASGFAGYVHFAPPVQCEVRVLMLLYSTRRKQFMGLIPNEQNRFIQGIRALINKHKNMQTIKMQNVPGQMPNPGMQQPGQMPGQPGMPQNQPGMQPGMPQNQPGMPQNQPGMQTQPGMPNQPGMQNPQGMQPNQPGMPSNQPGMPATQGMPGQQQMAPGQAMQPGGMQQVLAGNPQGVPQAGGGAPGQVQQAQIRAGPPVSQFAQGVPNNQGINQQMALQRIEMLQNNIKQKEAHIMKEAERQKKTLEVARQQQLLAQRQQQFQQHQLRLQQQQQQVQNSNQLRHLLLNQQQQQMRAQQQQQQQQQMMMQQQRGPRPPAPATINQPGMVPQNPQPPQMQQNMAPQGQPGQMNPQGNLFGDDFLPDFS